MTGEDAEDAEGLRRFCGERSWPEPPEDDAGLFPPEELPNFSDAADASHERV